MGVYQKTSYPGIMKHIGKKGPVYVIDFYACGKRRREKVGPLLGEAQKKLADKRGLARSRNYVAQSVQKKATLYFTVQADALRPVLRANRKISP